ncbi:MAG: hypothetical protein ACE5NA_00145 [Nitrospiraceae bacterium]
MVAPATFGRVPQSPISRLDAFAQSLPTVFRPSPDAADLNAGRNPASVPDVRTRIARPQAPAPGIARPVPRLAAPGQAPTLSPPAEFVQRIMRDPSLGRGFLVPGAVPTSRSSGFDSLPVQGPGSRFTRVAGNVSDVLEQFRRGQSIREAQEAVAAATGRPERLAARQNLRQVNAAALEEQIADLRDQRQLGLETFSPDQLAAARRRLGRVRRRIARNVPQTGGSEQEVLDLQPVPGRPDLVRPIAPGLPVAPGRSSPRPLPRPRPTVRRRRRLQAPEPTVTPRRPVPTTADRPDRPPSAVRRRRRRQQRRRRTRRARRGATL